jgi:hypothetical protein
MSINNLPIDVRGLRRPIGAFEITCAIIGAAAIGLASFVYWGVGDQNGASLILMGAAGLNAVLMNGARKAQRD